MRANASTKYPHRTAMTGCLHASRGARRANGLTGNLAKRINLCLLLLACASGAGASEKEIRDSIALGALVFSDNCKSCHQTDGYGEEGLYPSLRNPELLANKPLLIQTILHGRTNHTGDGAAEPRMPSLDYLTNREIAAIIAFISSSWGQDVLLVTEQEIKAAR